jgi:hypothetical protein
MNEQLFENIVLRKILGPEKFEKEVKKLEYYVRKTFVIYAGHLILFG